MEQTRTEVVKETGHSPPLPWGPPRLSLGIYFNVGGRRSNTGVRGGVQW